MAAVSRNPLSALLDIETPIFCAPMGGGLAGAELVAAISNAGGCGVLGGGALPPAQLRALVRDTRARTARPFGAGVLLPLLSGGEVEALCAERVAFVWLFWGEVAPHARLAHAAGVRVFAQIGSLEEARAAVSGGADVIVAQGFEAGGHVRGSERLAALLPAVVAGVAPVPVIAAGGIGDASDVARVMSLGAQGVALGTRFLASDECLAAKGYKARVVAARPEDTVHTRLFDGGWPDAPHRVLRTPLYERWERAAKPDPGARPGEGELVGKTPLGGRLVPVTRYSVLPPLEGCEGDVADYALYAGESVRAVKDVRPAAELVRELARGLA
jgi:nitronate monooxygenase/enoyl-[acyl-carrier protein] reductase II